MMYSRTPLLRPSLLRQKMAYQEGWLLSGIEINIFMFRFILSRAFPEGVASCQGGLSKGFQSRKLTLKVPLDNQFNCSIVNTLQTMAQKQMNFYSGYKITCY